MSRAKNKKQQALLNQNLTLHKNMYSNEEEKLTPTQKKIRKQVAVASTLALMLMGGKAQATAEDLVNKFQSNLSTAKTQLIDCYWNKNNRAGVRYMCLDALDQLQEKLNFGDTDKDKVLLDILKSPEVVKEYNEYLDAKKYTYGTNKEVYMPSEKKPELERTTPENWYRQAQDALTRPKKIATQPSNWAIKDQQWKEWIQLQLGVSPHDIKKPAFPFVMSMDEKLELAKRFNEERKGYLTNKDRAESYLKEKNRYPFTQYYYEKIVKDIIVTGGCNYGKIDFEKRQYGNFVLATPDEAPAGATNVLEFSQVDFQKLMNDARKKNANKCGKGAGELVFPNIYWTANHYWDRGEKVIHNEMTEYKYSEVEYELTILSTRIPTDELRDFFRTASKFMEVTSQAGAF